MNKNYSIGEINFHLLKRKTKKQGNVYYLAILGEEIGKNGHRTYKSMRSTGVGNIGLARKIANQILEEGGILAGDNLLEDYLTKFWDIEESEYLKSKLAEGRKISISYIQNNLALVQRYVIPYFQKHGVTKLKELTRQNLLAWRNDLYANRVNIGHLIPEKLSIEGHKVKTPQSISCRTVNAARQALFVPLQFAVDMDILKYHPGHGVKPVHESDTEQRLTFQIDEYQTLFAVEWTDIRYKAACLLAACTGARMGEIRGLQIKNLHLDDGYMDILTSYQDSEGIKVPKWNSTRTNIPISREAIDAIRQVLKAHKWGALPDQFVFFNMDSSKRPCGTRSINMALESAVKLAQLKPGRSMHSFRHTFASIAESKGFSQTALRELLGWSNEKTAEGYKHATNADRDMMRNIIEFRKAQ